MPKCTINGKEVEVKDGQTIMEAFKKADEPIAHYCYHPGLSVAGVCRLCICDIEGNPRPQIACNTTVTEGMKVSTKSDKVKEGVKWVLDFHLINHPLDCPICDQAGECGLQEQYMAFGKYEPEMAEKKVKKHKVVDLGPTVVLDSERCILCSRCVRFTEEVSKTNELGIFNRGDRSEIGCVEGKSLDNKYSLNTVDICPVGALTSKDFRFKQRVWYLKDSDTVCNGCSTGCNVKVYFNKEGMFRVKPVHNEQVNGYWMCDEGRNIYQFANKENRFEKGIKKLGGASLETMLPGALAKELHQLVKSGKDQTAVVLTGQYTSEEYDSFIGTLSKEFGIKKVYHWNQNEKQMGDFDGLLIRGDKNPNTKGLLKVFEKHQIKTEWQDLEKSLESKSIKNLIVAGPENLSVFADMDSKLALFSKAENLIWLGAAKVEALTSDSGKVKNKNIFVIPLKSFVEKEGTFVNHSGLEQKFKKATTILHETLTLTEVAILFAGKNLTLPSAVEKPAFVESQRRSDQVQLEHRKKNEFVFKRGTL
ncbi:MAG: (2Fe-2S)-binding protein [Bdellovibrionaceae bacterium]|nr:(2Fe-2S)-binding protein [Pseudobdellovibrionaceae bacterium]